MKYQLSITMTLFIGFCLVMLPPVSEILADVEPSDINLELSPDGTLFELDNLKPGDWAPRTVTVNNAGNKSLDFQMKVRTTSTDKLYNELLLEIESQNKILYSGKLADYEKLQSNLASEEAEVLQLTIRFPKHLGNDYRARATTIEFMFTAQDEENGQDKAGIYRLFGSGDDGTGGGMTQLPKTATTIYNYLIIGALIFASGLLLAIYDRKRKINNQMLN